MYNCTCSRHDYVFVPWQNCWCWLHFSLQCRSLVRDSAREENILFVRIPSWYLLYTWSIENSTVDCCSPDGLIFNAEELKYLRNFLNFLKYDYMYQLDRSDRYCRGKAEFSQKIVEMKKYAINDKSRGGKGTHSVEGQYAGPKCRIVLMVCTRATWQHVREFITAIDSVWCRTMFAEVLSSRWVPHMRRGTASGLLLYAFRLAKEVIL